MELRLWLGKAYVWVKLRLIAWVIWFQAYYDGELTKIFININLKLKYGWLKEAEQELDYNANETT